MNLRVLTATLSVLCLALIGGYVALEGSKVEEKAAPMLRLGPPEKSAIKGSVAGDAARAPEPLKQPGAAAGALKSADKETFWNTAEPKDAPHTVVPEGGQAAPLLPGVPERAAAGSPQASGSPAKDAGIHAVVPQENLSLLYIVSCSACHGKDGHGPVGPSIAGKSYEYNLSQLIRYKENKVENTMMKDLLTRTSLEDLKMLAREISNFKPRN